MAQVQSQYALKLTQVADSTAVQFSAVLLHPSDRWPSQLGDKQSCCEDDLLSPQFHRHPVQGVDPLMLVSGLGDACLQVFNEQPLGLIGWTGIVPAKVRRNNASSLPRHNIVALSLCSCASDTPAGSHDGAKDDEDGDVAGDTCTRHLLALTCRSSSTCKMLHAESSRR
eukprot:347992-Hanusia_phi.AAC.1